MRQSKKYILLRNRAESADLIHALSHDRSKPLFEAEENSRCHNHCEK